MLVIVITPIVVYARKEYNIRKEKNVIEILCNMLFPNGEEQLTETIESLMEITSNRFSTKDVLDYYLKIKGLQILDLNTIGNDDVSNYVTQPTRIRLHYDELVRFYEKYINYPQAKGLNATQH